MPGPTQTFTVEYLVSGALDGSTPSPAFSTDQGNENYKRPDEDGVYRFKADELENGNLGLIDILSDFGDSNAFANRIVTWFYLDAPAAPGAPDAVVESANLRDGVAQQQILHADLAGKERFFGVGFFVPQGSRLRVNGFTAGAEPILVRLNVQTFASAEDLLVALAELNGNGGNGGGGGVGPQFAGYLTTNTTIPGATLTPMPINALDFAFDSAVYEHSLGSSDVKILEDGRYVITAEASIEATANPPRSTTRTEVYVDDGGGGGFVMIPGSAAYGFYRDKTNGSDTSPITKIVDLSAGDVIRAASVRISGAAPLRFIGGGCRLSLVKIPEV